MDDRDAAGPQRQFEPQIVKKHQTRLDGFDDKILSMYARGHDYARDPGTLQEMYGVEVKSDADLGGDRRGHGGGEGVAEPAAGAVYGIVYLDALYVKMRHEGRVENRAVYVAIGVDMEGQKDVLGLWTSGNEGAKFWLGVLTELKNRGVHDI